MEIKRYEDMDLQALDVMREIGSIGTSHAATALSKLLQKEVRISIPSVNILGYNDAMNRIGDAEELVAAALVKMSGDIEGLMLFLFDLDFANEVLEKLLGSRYKSFLDMDEMARSALVEVGNIIICSYINAFSQLVNVEVELSTDRKLAQWIQNGAKNEDTASKAVTGSAVSGKTSYMDTVTKDESTENLDIRQILDMKELQRIQDLFLTATGMTAAVVDMKGKYITKGSSFTSFYSRYTSGKHNELREFTQDLTVGGFRAGTVIGGIVLGDYPGDSAPSQEVVSAGGQLLAEMLNLWANALYYRKSNADSVEAFAKEEKKVRDAVGQIKYKAKGLEQTATMEKMLSLNAAIEAGRAGKAGVGFGVVADEIGRMANESAAVYQEIQELVKQVEESMERLGE